MWEKFRNQFSRIVAESRSKGLLALKASDVLFALAAGVIYAIPTTITAFIINGATVNQAGLSGYILLLLSLGALTSILVNIKQSIKYRVNINAKELGLIDNMMTLLLNLVVQEAKNNCNTLDAPDGPKPLIRANFMLVSEGILYIRKQVYMNDPDEIHLTWPMGKGVCGVVWEDNRQRRVDLTVPEDPTKATWRYPTEKHRELTKDLKSVLCTPVVDESNPNQVLGVLNIDSPADLESTNFGNIKFMQTIGDYATMFSKLVPS